MSQGTVVCMPSDSLDSQSEPESEQCRIVPGKPFPKLVQQSLKSLYERGMIGWGRKHAAAVVIAMKTTGLTENQVKVCYVLGNLYALKHNLTCRTLQYRIGFGKRI